MMDDPMPTLAPLRRIATPKGDVFHVLKVSDESFVGFGEAYVSDVAYGAIKGWKRHRRMTLNLACPVGAVRFVVRARDGRSQILLDTILAPDPPSHYRRLTVPPMLWFGFAGIGRGCNLVVNVASHPHDPQEADSLDLAAFDWPCERSLVAT